MAISNEDREAKVRSLLEPLSGLEVQTLCLEALRDWRREQSQEESFSMHGSLGRFLIPILGKRSGNRFSDDDINQLKEPFLGCQHEAWMTPVLEAMWKLVRAGLAIPHVARGNGYPNEYRLTPQGKQLLSSDADHPLVPGFLSRASERCKDLPDSVIAILSDAQQCLDHALLRPAVILLGVSYETAIEQVIASLIARNELPENSLALKAAQRISKVKSVIDTVLPERDKRFAASAAYDFADTLRRRRNDGSHTKPTFPFEDRDEVEELLISASRHLPALWSMA